MISTRNGEIIILTPPEGSKTEIFMKSRGFPGVPPGKRQKPGILVGFPILNPRKLPEVLVENPKFHEIS
jgi:hypothetical protein